MLGDRTQGVYNLRISNASLEDDAEYQCQVGPAKFNSAIRANAKLIVICEYYLTFQLQFEHHFLKITIAKKNKKF